MYKLVIFDFDKTLYEGRHFALHLLWQNMPHILRVKREREVRKSLAGKDLLTHEALHGEMVARLAKATGLTPDEADEWYSVSYARAMIEVLSRHHEARPGAREAICALLDAGIRVGVLSDYPDTRGRMNAIGLTDERVECWSAEEFGALKPSPRPFIEAAALVGVAPGEVLVVGDRADTDGAGAKAAGMDALLIKGKKATGDDGFEALPWPEVASRLMSIAKLGRQS